MTSGKMQKLTINQGGTNFYSNNISHGMVVQGTNYSQKFKDSK